MATRETKWLDASVPLTSGMVHWPGDPEPSFERIADMDQGSEVNVTFCRMPAHTGTHMDAPCHFLAGAQGIDRFPLEVGIGPARIIEFPEHVTAISRAELEDKGLQRGERVLFKTRNSQIAWHDCDFQRDFVAVNASGAEFLAQTGVALVGVDYLSVGLFEADGAETHRTLLQSGIWIVEGLRLLDVPAGKYDLICLPLRIAGCDGSPARVVLRPR